MANQLITKAEATQAGLARYFTGKPCRHGHLAERYTKKSTCVMCALARAEAQRKKNAEATKKYQAQYRIQNKTALRAAGRERWANDKDQINAARRNQTAEEKEVRAARSRRYYHANKDQVNVRVRSLRPKYRARDNALSNTKKARKINATPAWADMTAIKAIYERAAELGAHVDHIIPLRSKLVCGLHVETNLRPLSAVDNMKKHNSFNPEDYEWSFAALAVSLKTIFTLKIIP